MVYDDEKLALDTQYLDIYLTTLQAEVEAKIRHVRRFREQMKQLGGAPIESRDFVQRERAARALVAQVDQMLETNLVVRQLLQNLRGAAQAILADLSEG